jgi:hypothetical protein
MRPQRQRHGDLGCALVAMSEFPDQPVGLGPKPRELERILDPQMNFGSFRAADREKSP